MNVALDLASFSSLQQLTRDHDGESDLGAQALPISGARSEARSAPVVRPSEQSNGQIRSFPYATSIRRLIEKDQVGAARRLLQVALSQGNPEPALARWQAVLAPPVVRTSTMTDVDRDLDYRWIDEKASAYSGQWVAIFCGELLAHAATLKEVLTELRASPPTSGKPLVFRVS